MGLCASIQPADVEQHGPTDAMQCESKEQEQEEQFIITITATPQSTPPTRTTTIQDRVRQEEEGVLSSRQVGIRPVADPPEITVSHLFLGSGQETTTHIRKHKRTQTGPPIEPAYFSMSPKSSPETAMQRKRKRNQARFTATTDDPVYQDAQYTTVRICQFRETKQTPAKSYSSAV